MNGSAISRNREKSARDKDVQDIEFVEDIILLTYSRGIFYYTMKDVFHTLSP